MKKVIIISLTILISFSCKENKGSKMFSSIAHSFEYALENPNKITSISIKEKGLKKIPESIDGRFIKLFQIILDKNQISNIPESIGEIDQLKYIHISNNKLVSLPKSIGNLKNIELFYAYSNEIKSLPNTSFNFNKDAIVDLKWNKIEQIPDAFCNSQFGSLYLTSNPLKELPKNFGNIKGLKELNIANTNIDDLPTSFFSLKNLKMLDIRGTKLSKNHFNLIKAQLPNCVIRSDFN